LLLDELRQHFEVNVFRQIANACGGKTLGNI
jgi:hypothetical protein